MGVRVSVLATALLLASCGALVESTSVEMTEAEEACVDFYRSVEESTEEEATYMRVFADRIAEAGHPEAAAVLSDLADQWEVGVWEGEQDEVWQSGLWAKAGRLLGEAGELRCTDLAEWWGIDGYEGEPDPVEVLNRQASIWRDNGLDSYYLLVAGKTESDERFTQIQVKVTNGQVDEVIEVETTSLDPSNLPKTIDEYYELIFDLYARVDSFNLVHAYPRQASTSDGTEYFVTLDTSDYPDALEYFDTLEGGGEKG